MKLTKTALLKKPVFISGFGNNGTPQDVYGEFNYNGWNEPAPIIPKTLKILYAEYTYEDYSGDAYVLGFDKEKNQFFEVHGSHCSCYGLEDQCEPEYYENVDLLQCCIQKRFHERYEYSRYANSSEGLEVWLFGEISK